MSGIEVAALVKEFAPLIGRYVSNIYSMGEAQLIKLRKGDEEKTLVVSPRLGVWLTSKGGARSTTSAFTTSLRKELLRLKLEGVSQVDMDRVFLFTFSDKRGKKELAVELMPPGNIVVLEEQKVSLVLREIRSPQRRILKGLGYSPPPQSRTPADRVDRAALRSMFEAEAKVGRALGRGISLPRRYVDEILNRAGLAQHDSSPKSDEGIDEIDAKLGEILEEARRPRPYLVLLGEVRQLMAVKPTIGKIERVGDSFSQILDEIFDPAAAQEESDEKKASDKREGEYRSTLEKLALQVDALEEEAASIRKVANSIRGAGAPGAVQEMLQAIRRHVPENSFKAIDSAASPSSKASLLFDLAKKDEAEVERIREAAADIRKRMEKELRHAERRQEPRERKPRKKEWYEKFRWFFTSAGKLAIGGRDAHSNSILVKRHLESEDVVFHADLFGSPFFILKGGKKHSEEESREVAKATVAFSSGWKTGLGSADAYWVTPDQVSGTAPSGEYLAKGSFVIRGKKNFVTKNVMEVSIGIDSDGRIISGPEEALLPHAPVSLTLVPSREKSSDTAKKVLAEFKKAGLVNDHTVDDVARMLPSGGGKIIRRKAAS